MDSDTDLLIRLVPPGPWWICPQRITLKDGSVSTTIPIDPTGPPDITLSSVDDLVLFVIRVHSICWKFDVDRHVNDEDARYVRRIVLLLADGRYLAGPVEGPMSRHEALYTPHLPAQTQMG